MTPSKYTELTGIAVSDEALITAQIRRTKSMLETLLGYPLSKQGASVNLYNELGKSQTECACPDVDTENLNPADDVIGAYRLFSFNPHDAFLAVDPFTQLNAVKLVFVKQGEEPNGVTIRTLDPDEVRMQIGRSGWSKYIQRCEACICTCDCTDCVQLAVDANWMFESCLPDDLMYVWADMVTYYADCKRNIKSESITTHSYTKFDNTPPESEPVTLATIQRYAGPNGSAYVGASS